MANSKFQTAYSKLQTASNEQQLANCKTMVKFMTDLIAKQNEFQEKMLAKIHGKGNGKGSGQFVKFDIKHFARVTNLA